MAHEEDLKADMVAPAGGEMTGTADAGTPGMEFEVRGDYWEGLHAVIFYISVTCAILATVGIARIVLGISCIVLLFYSMFTIFSSPTFVRIDPAAHQVIVERYRYFIPRRRRFPREEVKEIAVIESPRTPAPPGEKGSRRDLSYFVRVYIEVEGGGRFKIFRSGITGSPYENREKAYLITTSVAAALDVPVAYSRRGVDEED